MPRSSMLSIDEEVPIISSLHYGFEGGFAINVIRACRTMLLKSGPVCTYSTILSMLSITISEDFDLYASLNTLSMLLIFPSGPTPTNFSGVISFTNSNFDWFEKWDAIVVVPEPCSPNKSTEFIWWEVSKVSFYAAFKLFIMALNLSP